MAKVITARLGSESIGEMIKELEKYKDNIPTKCRRFVDRLSQEGIQVAKTQVGQYGGAISFTRKIDQSKYGANAIIYGKSLRPVHKGRKRVDKLGRLISSDYEVDPLLMAEFGSGWRAIEPEIPELQGVAGQGTYPEQEHAFDESGWYYIDENGSLVHTFGEFPTRPMHMAMLEMKRDLERIAREVFSR